jgi:hypothetical protein
MRLPCCLCIHTKLLVYEIILLSVCLCPLTIIRQRAFVCLCAPPNYFVFYAVRVLSKASMRLVIPKISCWILLFWSGWSKTDCEPFRWNYKIVFTSLPNCGVMCNNIRLCLFVCARTEWTFISMNPGSKTFWLITSEFILTQDYNFWSSCWDEKLILSFRVFLPVF